MSRFLLRILLAPALAVFLGCSGGPPPPDEAPQAEAASGERADRWEEAIRTFEKAAGANPPAKGGVVFYGSSSFRRWDLEKSFPGMGLINRGFGGSQMADAVRYLDRAVLPLEPRAIFVYEGDNDIASGKSPETVVADYRAFVAKARAALPSVRIVFVSIKPSLRRWELIGKMREANAQIRAIAEGDDLLEYIDAAAPLLGEDGKPRADLFVEDGLHLNDAGYAVWADLMRPHLD